MATASEVRSWGAPRGNPTVSAFAAPEDGLLLTRMRSNAVRFVPAIAVAAGAMFGSSAVHAESIIKRPGAHPIYDVEIEPHAVFQWDNRWGNDDGIGPGVRVNVNLTHDGFIAKVNDSVALGFGLDVTFGDNDCGWFYAFGDPRFRDDFRCTATEVWFPVVMQWNFWLTDVISVFGEPGLAFAHRRWTWEWYCGGAPNRVCEFKENDTDLEGVFWGGARFMFSSTVGATVRVGTPYVSAGLNFLL